MRHPMHVGLGVRTLESHTDFLGSIPGHTFYLSASTHQYSNVMLANSLQATTKLTLYDIIIICLINLEEAPVAIIHQRDQNRGIVEEGLAHQPVSNPGSPCATQLIHLVVIISVESIIAEIKQLTSPWIRIVLGSLSSFCCVSQEVVNVSKSQNNAFKVHLRPAVVGGW